MNRVFIVMLFAVTVTLEGIIMPALFGIRENFLTVIFLVALIVTYGTPAWVLGYGTVMAFIAEWFQGFYPGSLVMAWLLAAWAWYVMTEFLSIQPFRESPRTNIIGHTIAGLVLFSIVGSGFIGIEYLLYDRMITPAVLVSISRMPRIALFIAAAFAAYIMLLGSRRRQLFRYG